MTSILVRDRKEDRDTGRHREESQARTEAATEVVARVMLPQPTEGQETPELEEGGKDPPWSLWKKHHPANTLILDFWFPKLQENKFLLF